MSTYCSVHSHFQEFQLLNMFVLTHQFDFSGGPDGRQKRATSVRLGTAPWSRCSWCSPVLKLAHRRLLESHGARDTKGPEPSSVNVYKHAEERIWRRPESVNTMNILTRSDSFFHDYTSLTCLAKDVCFRKHVTRERKCERVSSVAYDIVI